MLRNPPLYKTYETPESIIGTENMSNFNDFYSIAISPTNGGEFPIARLKKEFTADALQNISEKLAELRANGFHPDGFNKHGRVKWAVTTKSEVQILMESDLARYEAMSIPELQRIAREGFKKIANR